MKRGKRWITALAIIAAIGLIIAVPATYLPWLLYSPAEPTIEHKLIEFEIEPGERLDSISRRLHQEGLLLDPAALKLAAFFGGGSEHIKAGTHRLRSDWNAWRIYRQLQQNPISKYIKIVIPEGFDMFEIAQRLEEAGVGKEQEFIRIVRDAGPISDLAPEASSLEGYLFPDTYHVPVSSGVEDVVGMMLRRFREIASGKMREEFAAVGLTLQEGVTLASMIAKEAGYENEMPLVSSVFHNRLRVGMKLDCDPTFIYARKLDGTWDGTVKGEDREIDSKYNTYKHGGLPPGPIGNPGYKALLAAANPADTKYLYFVAKGAESREGHYFSTNSADHNRAKAKYKEKRREALKPQD